MFTRLREDIASIRERDPAARSTWEVLTCYPGLHAIAIQRVAHAFWNRGFKWTGRFLSHVGRHISGIEIHPGAKIGRRVFIDHGMGVVVGETAELGDDCTIYQGVTLGGTSLYRGTKRHPTLGKGVVVGAGAKVLGGFTVGDYAKVGSNSVVVKPVPAGATAIGIPASFWVPSLAARMGNVRPLMIGLIVCYPLGYLGLMVAPVAGAVLWAVVIGVATAVFPLTLTLIGLRARTFPEGVEIADFTCSAEGQEHNGVFWVNYYPNGMCDAHSFAIADARGRKFAVKIDGITGEIHVEQNW